MRFDVFLVVLIVRFGVLVNHVRVASAGVD